MLPKLIVGSIGPGELLVILVVLVLYLVPIVVVCWALRTLWRMYKAQGAILDRLTSIEDLLRARTK